MPACHSLFTPRTLTGCCAPLKTPLVLSVVLACVVCGTALKPEEFRTCQDTGFCRRQRFVYSTAFHSIAWSLPPLPSTPVSSPNPSLKLGPRDPFANLCDGLQDGVRRCGAQRGAWHRRRGDTCSGGERAL